MIMENKPGLQPLSFELAADGTPITVSNGLAQHEEKPKTADETEAERRFVLKLDLTILPLLIVTFFLATLDRGDVSNAAVAGLDQDLHFTAKNLSDCVSFFYIGYIIFVFPGTQSLRVVSANVQLGLALILWGGFTAVIAAAQNWQTIAGLRVLVGSAESFIQAAPLYLTFYYKRQELAVRGAIFFSVMGVAGSMNGIISYGIQLNMDGVCGLPAWRWIFLIEGIISVAFGIVVFGILPPIPEKLRLGFWTASEKEIAIRRSREAFNVQGPTFNVSHFRAVVRDLKVYFLVVLQICTSATVAAFGNLLPTIVSSLQFSRLSTQLLTIPIWTFAALGMIFVCWVSDRVQKRGVIMIFCYALAAAGWLIMLVSRTMYLSYAGMYLAAAGSLPPIVVIQVWLNNNILGYTKKATTLAIILVLGQLFALVTVQINSDPPYYYRGNGFCLGVNIVGLIVAVGFQRYLRALNRKEKEQQGSEEATKIRGLDIETIMDGHPDFFYYL